MARAICRSSNVHQALGGAVRRDAGRVILEVAKKRVCVGNDGRIVAVGAVDRSASKLRNKGVRKQAGGQVGNGCAEVLKDQRRLIAVRRGCAGIVARRAEVVTLWIGICIDAIGFHRSCHGTHVCLCAAYLGTRLRFKEVGDGDGRQNGDNRHDDQQLDQGKTQSFSHGRLLREGMSPAAQINDIRLAEQH